MPEVVYGLFEEREQAKSARGALTTRTEQHPAFRTFLFTRAPLDGDDLPEAATDLAGNTVVHTAIGAVTCIIMGVAAAAAGIIPGLSMGMGAAAGAMFGIIAGVLNGLMAGARSPKPALRELEAEIEKGMTMLLIEVDDAAQARVASTRLEELGASLRGRC